MDETNRTTVERLAAGLCPWLPAPGQLALGEEHAHAMLAEGARRTARELGRNELARRTRWALGESSPERERAFAGAEQALRAGAQVPSLAALDDAARALARSLLRGAESVAGQMHERVRTLREAGAEDAPMRAREAATDFLDAAALAAVYVANGSAGAYVEAREALAGYDAGPDATQRLRRVREVLDRAMGPGSGVRERTAAVRRAQALARWLRDGAALAAGEREATRHLTLPAALRDLAAGCLAGEPPAPGERRVEGPASVLVLMGRNPYGLGERFAEHTEAIRALLRESPVLVPVLAPPAGTGALHPSQRLFDDFAREHPDDYDVALIVVERESLEARIVACEGYRPRGREPVLLNDASGRLAGERLAPGDAGLAPAPGRPVFVVAPAATVEGETNRLRTVGADGALGPPGTGPNAMGVLTGAAMAMGESRGGSNARLLVARARHTQGEDFAPVLRGGEEYEAHVAYPAHAVAAVFATARGARADVVYAAAYPAGTRPEALAGVAWGFHTPSTDQWCRTLGARAEAPPAHGLPPSLAPPPGPPERVDVLLASVPEREVKALAHALREAWQSEERNPDDAPPSILWCDARPDGEGPRGLARLRREVAPIEVRFTPGTGTVPPCRLALAPDDRPQAAAALARASRGGASCAFLADAAPDGWGTPGATLVALGDAGRRRWALAGEALGQRLADREQAGLHRARFGLNEDEAVVEVHAPVPAVTLETLLARAPDLIRDPASFGTPDAVALARPPDSPLAQMRSPADLRRSPRREVREGTFAQALAHARGAWTRGA